MKRVQFVKNLFVVIIMLSLGGMTSVFAQGDEMHLPCLKKVYLASDSEILLDCKPEDSKYIPFDRFTWTVKKVKGNGLTVDEIKGCIKKKRGRFYLLPGEIYKKMGDKEVAIEYSQYTNDGRGYSIHFLIKVIDNQ
ncbi:MAG: hypothetical protein N4A71_06530 [Carboxylicivirga sp.]|nr:hypothetical protein [Carboxylicivirga sp.]